MGRERQKKKNRSSLQKAKLKIAGRTKAGKKKVNFLGSKVIADNWDRKLTMSQNYKRLGLSSRLNAATGGVEQRSQHSTGKGTESMSTRSLVIPKARKMGKLLPQQTRVERDPDTGHILRILHAGGEREMGKDIRQNPLDDPLNDTSDAEDIAITSQPSAVVAELEAQAKEEADRLSKNKRPRQQSQRETEWLQKLVEVHGQNTKAMMRDRKLNPMQQSEADISRRLRTWKEKHITR